MGLKIRQQQQQQSGASVRPSGRQFAEMPSGQRAAREDARSTRNHLLRAPCHRGHTFDATIFIIHAISISIISPFARKPCVCSARRGSRPIPGAADRLLNFPAGANDGGSMVERKSHTILGPLCHLRHPPMKMIYRLAYCFVVLSLLRASLRHCTRTPRSIARLKLLPRFWPFL